MSYVLSSILLIALSFVNITLPSAPQMNQQRQKVALTPFNVPKMPVRINTAQAENTVTSSSVEYSMTNSNTERILRVDVSVFIADSAGKVIKLKDMFSFEPIDPGVTVVDHADLPEKVTKRMTLFIAVNRVLTPSGLWFVEDADLAAAIKTKVSKQADSDPVVSFQTHAVTSEEDRRQIFELILRDILQDKKKSEMLQDPSKLVLLRDSVRFNLPDNLIARLVTLDKEEIQALADVEQKVIYLIYEPLKSEGSQVFATILLRDTIARQPLIKFRVPFAYAFSFHCVKDNGRWVIRKSYGFAQG